MTSYWTFAGWLDQGLKMRRLTYLWGDEYRLIERAVDRLRHQDGIDESYGLVATGKNDGDIWGELNQYPPPGKKRYFVVRDAHLMSNFAPLDVWLRRGPVSACMVGNDRDFDGPLRGKGQRCPRGHKVLDAPVVVRYQREIRYCPVCRATRKMLITRARVVRCGKSSSKAQHDAVIAMVKVEADVLTGTYNSSAMVAELLRACDWSTGSAFEALSRLELLNSGAQTLPLSEDSIKRSVTRSAGGDFVAALRQGNRARAVELAREVDPETVSGVLAACERWIGLAARGASAVRAGRDANDIKNLLGISWSDAAMIHDHAGRYSAAAVTRAIEALAAADQAMTYHTVGEVSVIIDVPVGVLEQLALQW